MNEMPDIDTGIPANAVSLYESPMDEFPVLKAFQQYIDAEQAKARKRMLGLGIFFGMMMVLVIAVFVFLLSGASIRNQQLNDKLLDFVMKDRDRPTVVQQQDNAAVDALAAKIDAMQKQFEAMFAKTAEAEQARQQEAERTAAETIAAQKEVQEQIKTKESEEIIRLKALLAAEKQKNAEERKRAEEERKRLREEEIEAYRRKHYPEFYEQKQQAKAAEEIKVVEEEGDPIEALLKEIGAKHAEPDEDIEEDEEAEEAISYFEEEVEEVVEKPKAETRDTKPKGYTIPVEVKGSRGKWRIPNN